jgi:hypothetical protein
MAISHRSLARDWNEDLEKDLGERPTVIFLNRKMK